MALNMQRILMLDDGDIYWMHSKAFYNYISRNGTSI